MRNKKLYYTITDSIMNKDPERYISMILEPSTRSKSCWFSKLPGVPKGLQGLKNAIFTTHRRIMRGGAHSSDSSHISGKFCPAIQSVLDKSILVKCPSDLAITITSNREFVFTTPGPQESNPLVRISSHDYSQMENPKDPILFEEYMNIKFLFPLVIGNTTGTPWIFLQPNFHTNFEFTVLNGVVPSGYTKYQELNLNTLVKIPKKGEPPREILIKKGTVLAYIWTPEQLVLTHRSSVPLPLFTKFIGAVRYGNDSDS
jgi:hypothetical protein